MANLREHSKANFPSENWNFPTEGEIQTGALQRIADATELMAKNHKQLVNDRDLYEKWFRAERAARLHRDNQIRSLRGVITKLRKRAELMREGR
jgi:hypothetical protein